MNESNENIKVTVLLPVYNAEKYIAEAVNSVLNQTFEEFELLILNDGSTDKSVEILRSIEDERITIINNPKNLGLIATLNRGLEKAKGKYIARMDADDICYPNRFEEQVKFLDENEDYVIVGSNFLKFGFENGESNLWNEDEQIRVAVFFESPLAHPTTMFRRDVISANRLTYDKRYLHLEDWALWFRILQFGKAKNLECTLLKYRLEDQNITTINHHSVTERATSFLVDHLSYLYKDDLKNWADIHWAIAKGKFIQGSINELMRVREEVKSAMINYGLSITSIDDFFKQKNEQMFYGISNSSGLKALKFARKTGQLNLKTLIYGLKKCIRK